MTFALLPAIDVADGRVVRLDADATVTGTTSADPLEVALAWQSDGAEWIHLVDLDAAFGRGSNRDVLASVIGALDVQVELSGGICDAVSLERALATGCERVVVGTAGLADADWCARTIAAHGDRIAVGLDVRVDDRANGSVRHRLASRGIERDMGELWESLARFDLAGAERYVVTDVGTDGALGGPNVDLYRAVTSATAARVIASGGIAAIDDLVVLAEMAAAGSSLEGSIVGRALHTGRFTLSEALRAVRQVDVTDEAIEVDVTARF